jgi:hypothetical protein
LQDNVLTYHKSDSVDVTSNDQVVRTQARGTIILDGATWIQKWDGKPGGFTINVQGRCYYLNAETDTDRWACQDSISHTHREEWITFLLRAAIHPALKDDKGKCRSAIPVLQISAISDSKRDVVTHTGGTAVPDLREEVIAEETASQAGSYTRRLSDRSIQLLETVIKRTSSKDTIYRFDSSGNVISGEKDEFLLDSFSRRRRPHSLTSETSVKSTPAIDHHSKELEQGLIRMSLDLDHPALAPRRSRASWRDSQTSARTLSTSRDSESV